MELVFCPAEADDIEPVMEMVAAAQAFLRRQGVDQWQNGYPNRARVSEDVALRVAYVMRGRFGPVAYGVLTTHEEPSYVRIHEGAWSFGTPYATLHRLCAAPAARGSGAAAQLVAGLEQLARRKGMCGMRTDTHRHNRPMRRFLEKQDFGACGVIHLAQPGVGGALGDERIAYEKALLA